MKPTPHLIEAIDDALPNFRSAGWLILLSLDLQIADGTPLADKP
jgi:hypothetical protein